MKIPDQLYFERWERSNIPIATRGKDFRHYQPVHATGQRAFEASAKFVKGFKDHYVSDKRAAVGDIPDDRSKIGRGLMFYGGNGTRKTTLATAVLTEVQYLNASYQVHYIRFSDWREALTDSFNKDSHKYAAAVEILRRVEDSHLVVLDDLGQEYTARGSDFNQKNLHELLRRRYEKARPTIITTNIAPEAMRDAYDDSFESFRHDAFDSYMFLGDDSRLMRK